MIRRPPRSTRTATLFPYTTLLRSIAAVERRPLRPAHCLASVRHYHGGASPAAAEADLHRVAERSEEHTSELQSLMRISYAVFCLKKKNISIKHNYLSHTMSL